MVLENNKAPEIVAAIAYFEEAVRESDEIISKCSPALQAELTEQRRHFVAALEALKRETAEPPNDPLTLEKLRGMDGDPVWVEFIGKPDGSLIPPLWMLVNVGMRQLVTDVEYVDWSDEGWTAYRRKPDGGVGDG